GQQFQLTINTRGRLTDPDEFADIIVKTGSTATAQTTPGGTSGASGQNGQLSSGSLTGRPQPQSTGIVRLRDVVTTTESYTVISAALASLRASHVPDAVLTKLAPLAHKDLSREQFLADLDNLLTREERIGYRRAVLERTRSQVKPRVERGSQQYDQSC